MTTPKKTVTGAEDRVEAVDRLGAERRLRRTTMIDPRRRRRLTRHRRRREESPRPKVPPPKRPKCLHSRSSWEAKRGKGTAAAPRKKMRRRRRKGAAETRTLMPNSRRC